MKSIRVLTLIFIVISSSSQTWADNDKSELVQNRGSDSMAIAVIAWAEAYKRIDRKARISVSGGGSGTGIAGLLNGTTAIANSSRAITEKEAERARSQGIEPTEHLVGYDAVAIYVHKDNPIDSLSKSQLKEIYADGGKVDSWSDLGLEVPGCKDQKIVRVSRQNSSGTYARLRQMILGGNRYRQGTLEMQGSKDVVELVGKTPCAIGYSSYAYTNPDVQAVCITMNASDNCVIPNIGAVTDSSYPLARPLFMYTDGPPAGEIQKYLNWVLSDEGQCILLQNKYAPVRKVSCGG